jgi:hypothetical protein
MYAYASIYLLKYFFFFFWYCGGSVLLFVKRIFMFMIGS